MNLNRLFLFSLCLFALSCQQAGETSFAEEMDQRQMAPEVPEADEAISVKQVGFTPMLIKTGYLNLEVDSYASSRNQILDLVKASEGYVAAEQENKSSYQLSNEMSIRVPAAKFDSLMEQISSMALTLNQRTVEVRDVSEEFIDLESRLQTKKIAEGRYQDLLQKARSVEDILAIEEAIRKIREEVEAKEGRLRFLKNQVGYSTLNVYLFEQSEFASFQEPSFWRKMKDGFAGGWQGVLGVFLALAYSWPLLLLLGAGISYMVIKSRRNRQKKS